MAYNITYNMLSFNASDSVLYLTVYLQDDATLLKTVTSYPVRLPVDNLGNVPTGTALTNHIDAVLAAVYNNTILDRIKVIYDTGGQVTNAQDIFALTSAVEPNEITGIPVTLYPDPDYTVGGYVTRSVLESNGGYLDNGNIVASAGLSYISTTGEAVQTGPFAIINANDNTETLSLTSWVTTTFPSVEWNFSSPGVLNVAFDGIHYYIEHDPILMNGTSTGYFRYN